MSVSILKKEPELVVRERQDAKEGCQCIFNVNGMLTKVARTHFLPPAVLSRKT